MTATSPSSTQNQNRDPLFEPASCYYCGATAHRPFLTAEDDLSGKPGKFTFVTCSSCGLHYQSPRVRGERIKEFYDDEYIAHRKQSHWGLFTRFHERAMRRHDEEKERIVRRYVDLDAHSEVLDVGCAVGTFLKRIHDRTSAKITGVDFKDLRSFGALKEAEFHCGFFYDQNVGTSRFDLVTMWHFLEHEYDPMRTLAKARSCLKKTGRLVIEVPRLDSASFRLFKDRWPGLQAPQHTILFDKKMLTKVVTKAGFEVVDYLPYGAFPAYFYLFAGAAFKLLKGKGLNPYLAKAVYPYYFGNAALMPILAFEKKLNLAMQTIVCKVA